MIDGEWSLWVETTARLGRLPDMGDFRGRARPSSARYGICR